MERKEVAPLPPDAAALARRASPRVGVPGLARDAIDDLVGLFGSQLELARAELRADARAAARSGLRLVIYVPVLTIGYCLVLVAGLLWLSTLVGWLPVLVSAGLIHVVVAVLGLRRAGRRLAQVHFLDRAGAELEKSVDQVSEAIQRPSLKTTP